MARNLLDRRTVADDHWARRRNPGDQLQRQLIWTIKAPLIAVGSVDGPVTLITVRSPLVMEAVELVFEQLEPPLAIEQESAVSAELIRTVKRVVDPAAFAFHCT